MTDSILEAAEIRVLGVLVEKQLSTPEYYPLTINALTTACNQKTNRDPVSGYTSDEVTTALETLQRRRLIGTVSGASSRSVKYRHALAEAWKLDEAGLTAMASLMLRGPQTVGEVRGRTGRMHAFDTLEAVQDVFDALNTREPPLVTQLPLQPGRKEVRYAHLLAGPPDPEAFALPLVGDARVVALEHEVEDLRDALEALRAEFEAFRREFE